MRLFVALQPTDPAREALAALADEVSGVRWVPAAQLHLTLRFIGEVSEGDADKIAGALIRVRVQPFFLELTGTGGFPPRGSPGILWAGVGAGHPLLHQLRQQVDDRLLTTGVPFELRPFVPHFTVGRCRDAAPVAVAHWLKRHRDFAGPTWPVRQFHLMASNPANPNEGYRTLHTFLLGGPLIAGDPGQPGSDDKG